MFLTSIKLFQLTPAYVWLTILSYYGSTPLILGLIGRDGGLRTLSQLWVYLSAEGAKNVSWRWLSPLVWLWHLLVNLYIWLIISSCYGSIPLTLELIRRDGGLNTLCHSSQFSCQLRVLKTFRDPGYLCWSGYGTYW